MLILYQHQYNTSAHRSAVTTLSSSNLPAPRLGSHPITVAIAVVVFVMAMVAVIVVVAAILGHGNRCTLLLWPSGLLQQL